MAHNGRQVATWLAIVAGGLLVQSCGKQPPPAPSARVFAADLTGGAKACTVPRVTPEPGRTADVAMKVGNDGGWCAITVVNGGRPFDAGLLTAQPTHGHVLIHTVGAATRIDYTPIARFAGADSFSVRLVPGSAMIRVAVSVVP